MYNETIGDIYKSIPASQYMPSLEVQQFTSVVQKDYGLGHNILTRTWTEMNNRSLIEDENRGKLAFNAFVDLGIEDPAEAWKWKGTRSAARNKALQMHAQLTAAFLLPSFIAQNDDNDVDREFSETMQDIVEWMAQPSNSNYQSTFLQVVFGMMTNPVTYMGAEWHEVFQKIRERKDDGSYEMTEILDDTLSGFQAPIYSLEQVMITNAFQRDIQRQRSVIKRRWIEKNEAEAKYGEHENWKYVRNGWRTIYNVHDGLFYDVKDIVHPYLVEECIYMNRQEDTEVPFVGGIFLGDTNIDWNPMTHRDNRNRPKYPLAPFGYSRIGEHFFFYKSLMNIVQWDNELIDAMTEIVMNRSLLEVDMPVAVSGVGTDKIDSEVIFPKAVFTSEDPNFKMTPLLPPSNVAAGYNAIASVEANMGKESISDVMGGQMPNQPMRGMAYVFSQVQANAQKLIVGAGRTLAESMVWYGSLMKDIAINHLTVPMVSELIGDNLQLKYRKFILENKDQGGKIQSTVIDFDKDLIGTEMTEEEKEDAALELLEAEGYPDNERNLRKINPELFAKFNYLTKIDPEQMMVKNQEYWRPLLTNLYTMLRQDPLIKGDVLLRELLHSYFHAKGDKFIQENPVQPATPAQGQEETGNPPQPGENPLGKMAMGRELSTAAGLQRPGL